MGGVIFRRAERGRGEPVDFDPEVFFRPRIPPIPAPDACFHVKQGEPRIPSGEGPGIGRGRVALHHHAGLVREVGPDPVRKGVGIGKRIAVGSRPLQLMRDPDRGAEVVMLPGMEDGKGRDGRDQYGTFDHFGSSAKHQ